MLATIVLGFLLLTTLYGLRHTPHPRGQALYIVVREILRAREPTLRARLSMLAFVAAELMRLPLHALFALADELFARGYRQTTIKAPIFVIGQPRSGTTLLLRTLAEHDGRIVSAQHLEWRYPSIMFWRLLERFGLRDWLEQRSYWPSSELGKLCDRVHAHCLGNHEELGIFLEERLWRHYFLFRRFPFPKVLDSLCTYDSLDAGERVRMLDAVERTMKKILYFRGTPNAIFLTKENELADFHRDLLQRFPDARLVFVTRASRDVLASYRTMSDVCTRVKHGVDPETIDGWSEANTRFRLDEASAFVRFASDALADPVRRAIAIRYEELTQDIAGTVQRIHDALELPMSSAYRATLAQLDQEQRTRKSGYRNAPRRDDPRFAFMDRFAESISSATNAGAFAASLPTPGMPLRLDLSHQSETVDNAAVTAASEAARTNNLEHAA